MAKTVIEGVVTEVEETQRGTNTIRTVVVREDANGKYPKDVAVEFFGASKADEAAKCAVGFQVRVEAFVKSRKGNGRWFNDISGWKVEVLKSAGRPQHREVNADDDTSW